MTSRNGQRGARRTSVCRAFVRSGLLLTMAAIVSVGGLVPAHTELDHLQDTAQADDGGAHGLWKKIKPELVKILGTCMDYGVTMVAPAPAAVRVAAVAETGPLRRLPILARTIPRPPSA